MKFLERWHHVDDLDGFFINVYEYLQQKGLTCICLSGITSIMYVPIYFLNILLLF